MTVPPRPRAHVSRAEFDALRSVAGQAALDAAEALEMHRATHEMVKGIHDALIKPLPGQQHGLLHRTALLVNASDAGKAAGDKLIRMAKVIGAIGTVAAAAVAIFRYGQHVPPPK